MEFILSKHECVSFCLNFKFDFWLVNVFKVIFAGFNDTNQIDPSFQKTKNLREKNYVEKIWRWKTRTGNLSSKVCRKLRGVFLPHFLFCNKKHWQSEVRLSETTVLRVDSRPFPFRAGFCRERVDGPAPRDRSAAPSLNTPAAINVWLICWQNLAWRTKLSVVNISNFLNSMMELEKVIT